MENNMLMRINILIPLLVTTAPRRGNSSTAQGIALGIRYLRTTRPAVRATLNKTFIQNINAVNPLKNMVRCIGCLLYNYGRAFY